MISQNSFPPPKWYPINTCMWSQLTEQKSTVRQDGHTEFLVCLGLEVSATGSYFQFLFPSWCVSSGGCGISRSSTTTGWPESLGADLLPQTVGYSFPAVMEVLWSHEWKETQDTRYLETRKVNNNTWVFHLFPVSYGSKLKVWGQSYMNRQ